MSQLHSLIRTLNEAEIASLKSIRLIGKEKEVFDYVLKFKNSELPELTSILNDLAITDTHYYKINSILLRKAYQTIVPNQGNELLLYLKQKNLFTLLRHELLTQEKKTTKALNDAFYLQGFHYLIDFPYKFYDKKLTEIFGKKYLAHKNKSDLSDQLYVKYHLLFSEINRTAARKNPIKALGFTINDLLKQEKELEKTSHHLAKYYLYRCICSYYTYYEKSNTKIIEYLKKAISLKNNIAYFFPIDIGQFLELLYADALLSNNNISDSEKIYKKVFDSGVQSNMYGYYYHCEQYALVLIIQKKYAEAQALLNEIFEPCIANKIDIYATRGAMCFTKLYLSNGELKNALHYLNIAKSINEKSFYLPFDVQLRVLENIYFFLKKDYDFVLQLATRNIKFVRSQEQESLFSDYITIWKFISAFANSILKFQKPSKEMIKDCEYLQEKYTCLYCNLFNIIYKQTISQTH